MKKNLKFIIIIMLSILLVGCQGKKEYQAIEITGEELVSNLFTEEPKDIVFAFYNSDSSKYKEYIDDINKVSKNAKIDIYYLDVAHIDSGSYIMLTSADTLSLTEDSYYAYINGKLTTGNKYTNFKEMYSALKSIGYKSKIELTSKEAKEKVLSEAVKLYEDGQISKSKSMLEKVWSLEEAKKFYKDNDYFRIINSWERYEFLDKKMKNVLYVNINFISNSNAFYQIEKKSAYNKDFVKPSDLSEYEVLNYYIKDDIIYTSNEENSNYRETYKITYIDDKNLDLYDYKTKKENKYILRS